MIYLTLALLIIGTIAKSIMDTLAHHYESSIFENGDFYNPKVSWKNKYKNNDPEQGAKFFGSTTFLVWTTDAWHLFQTIFLSCYQLAIAINIEQYPWWITFIIIKLIYGTVFELFYKKVLIS